MGAIHRHGRLLLILNLPDGTRSLIPADWTNLNSSAPSTTRETPRSTTLAPIPDLLRACTIVDALLLRLIETASEQSSVEEQKDLAANSEFRRCSDPRETCVGRTRR